jgi:hypothetical protein
MKFTDSPFEKMMQEIPRPKRAAAPKPPLGSPCRSCSFWQGQACVGVCYKELFGKNMKRNRERER